MIFATYAATREQLHNCGHLVASLRRFGGRFGASPVWLFRPQALDDADTDALDVEVIGVDAPEEAAWLPFAGKVFSAAAAEERAAARDELLAWIDEDTIFLDEPRAFDLAPGTQFAFRPVMHNRTGSLYGQPPDAEWGHIFALLGLAESLLFPVTTPGDNARIRAYFNAGLLVVRPHAGVLRGWAEDFERLYGDERLVQICRDSIDSRVFLHQKALVGVCGRLPREAMVQLPDTYNYPLFFERQFEASSEFGSIDGIVTFRHDVYFRNPDPGWQEQLAGPTGKIAWLAERFNG